MRVLGGASAARRERAEAGALVAAIVTSILAVCLLAGCGASASEGETDRAKTSTTQRSTTSTEDSRPPTTSASTTTSIPEAITAGDIVGVACDRDTGQVSISTVDPGTESTTPVYDTTVEGQIDCSHRHTFSADFSKMLTTVDDPEATTPLTHVAVVDLATGEVTDLTATRSGSESFSSKPLNEYSPGFLGAGGSPLSYGSDDVVFFREGEPSVRRTSVSDPTKDEELIPLDFATDPGSSSAILQSFDEIPDHQEIMAGGVWYGSSNSTADLFEATPNPGGTLLMGELGADSLVWSASSTREAGHKIECPTDDPIYGSYASPVGWIDDHRIGMFGTERRRDDRGSDPGGTFMIVTVADDGSIVDCSENLIPENSNTFDPLPVWISLDGDTIDFSATSMSGDSKRYSMPVTGGEPTEAPDRPVPDGIVYLFRT